jgi:hypothetical protein
MPMNKAELTAHCAEYRSKMEAASAAEARGLYRDAIGRALSALDNVEGVLEFARKYENRRVERVSAIDLALKYAALLLDLKTVQACEAFVAQSRNLGRWTTADLPGAVAAARKAMWQNHGLWTLLEQSTEVRQDQLHYKLGGDAGGWRIVVEAWERMGLITRVRHGRTFLLTLSTRLGQLVPAKCSLCGHVTEAPKAMFLEVITCPACGQESDFVLVEPELANSSVE